MSKNLKMLPRTFVFENKEAIYVPKSPRTKKYCSCVYVCKQFMEYPADKWGRKIVPEGKICPHVKTQQGYPCICACDFVYRVLNLQGEITERGKDILYHLYKVKGFKSHVL